MYFILVLTAHLKSFSFLRFTFNFASSDSGINMEGTPEIPSENGNAQTKADNQGQSEPGNGVISEAEKVNFRSGKS